MEKSNIELRRSTQKRTKSLRFRDDSESPIHNDSDTDSEYFKIRRIIAQRGGNDGKEYLIV